MVAVRNGSLPDAKGERLIMIRRADPAEADHLSNLALRSKAHWGYPPDFLEACIQDLTLTPELIAENPIYVIEKDSQIQGFYGLIAREEDAVELEYLFVEPALIGGGFGRMLWHHAVRTARDLGFETMFINSDPHAEAFYAGMGAKRIGHSESVIWPGRMLPLMTYRLRY